MAQINICIPTLTKYDLLHKLILSAELGSAYVDNYFIIDNGRKLSLDLPESALYKCKVFVPPGNLGVAISWNWFAKNVPEMRLICNDDIVFFDSSLKALVENYRDDTLIFPQGLDTSLNMFSCFSFPDKLRDIVGDFDETISPLYAYFEDNDYRYRMKLLGVDPVMVPDSKVNHEGSSTVKSFNDNDMNTHHKKFRMARDRYKAKWGGLPEQERFTTPYNK